MKTRHLPLRPRYDAQEGAHMEVVQRSFRVEGAAGLGAKPRPELVGPVLTRVQASLQDSVRMGFLHSSRPRGRISGLLSRAAEARLIGIDGEGDHATWLHFEVPPFYSVAGDLFRQPLLWDDGPQPDDTAFELFGAALNDVAARKKESNRYDPALLERISRYRLTLRRGVTRILLPDAKLAVPSRVDEEIVHAASQLSAMTPEPRRVRIAGRLDVMGASEAVLKIDLRPGESVTAVWAGEVPVDELRHLFNRDVLLEGIGVFRPSGSLLRVDATAIRLASSQDEFFRQVPRAMASSDYRKALRLRPSEGSVYARILGSIPAEETDDEFAAAVDTLS